jgi:hypothetical protein
MLDAKLSSFQLKVIKWMIKLMFTGNCFFYGCWKLGFYCSLYVCKRLFSCFGDTDVCIIRTLYLRVCNLWWNEGSNEHYHVFLCRISFSYLTILCLTFLWHYLYTPESLSKKKSILPLNRVRFTVEQNEKMMVPWSARRGNLSEKERVLKKVKG